GAHAGAGLFDSVHEAEVELVGLLLLVNHPPAALMSLLRHLGGHGDFLEVRGLKLLPHILESEEGALLLLGLDEPRLGHRKGLHQFLGPPIPLAIGLPDRLLLLRHRRSGERGHESRHAHQGQHLPTHLNLLADLSVRASASFSSRASHSGSPQTLKNFASNMPCRKAQQGAGNGVRNRGIRQAAWKMPRFAGLLTISSSRGVGERGLMTMTPALCKATFLAHVTFSVGWLGAVLVYLALALGGLKSNDLELARSAYISMELVGWAVIVPLSLVTLLSGLLQSLGTEWGLFRHYWIVVKFVLATAGSIVLLVHMRVGGQMSGVARATALFAGEVWG